MISGFQEPEAANGSRCLLGAVKCFGTVVMVAQVIVLNVTEFHTFTDLFLCSAILPQ